MAFSLTPSFPMERISLGSRVRFFDRHHLMAVCGCFNLSFWSGASKSKWVSIFGNNASEIWFCLDINLNLRSNEFVITPIELKPMSAPAIDGVSIVPVTGSSVPAAIGIPTCTYIYIEWEKERYLQHDHTKIVEETQLYLWYTQKELTMLYAKAHQRFCLTVFMVSLLSSKASSNCIIKANQVKNFCCMIKGLESGDQGHMAVNRLVGDNCWPNWQCSFARLATDIQT